MDSTKLVRIDLDVALAGYLTGPDGAIRYIHGLDEIARDAILYGCVLYWDRDIEPVGLCYCWTGVVLLAPWLFPSEPWFVRRVISHEIAHHIVGQSEEAVARWMEEHRRGLVDEPEAIQWPA